MFGRKKVTEYQIKSGKEVAFVVRTSQKGVELEAGGKDWCLAFSNGTFEAGMINYLIGKEDNASVLELCRAMYMTRLMFKDSKLIKEFYQALERSLKRTMKATVISKEKDDEILAEEKLLHEKDEQSMNELINLKKRRENGKKRNRKR